MIPFDTTMSRRTSLFLGFIGASTFGLLLAGAGCGGPGAVGDAVRPADPTAGNALGEPGAAGGSGDACRAVGSYAEPLVVDLKSNERLDLELAMKEGVAVVSYDCKSLKLLKGCKLAGSYGFAGVSRKEDVVQITSSDELAANLPFSAVSLGGEVASGSSIDLALVMVGRKGTTVENAAKADLVGSCDGATHFIKSAMIGAFAMATGTSGKARAAAEIFGASAKAASSSEKRTANKDGDPESCKQATPDAPKPPDQCQSPIRLELVAVQGQREAKGEGEGAKSEEAQGPRNPCPEGMVLSGGKCTTGGDKPHLCKRDDAKDCIEQCEKGDAGSCHNLAWLHKMGKDVSKDEARANELFDKACNGGFANACYQRGWSYLSERLQKGKSEDAQTELRVKAEELMNKACQLGDAYACYNTSDWYLRDPPLAVFPKDPARAIAMIRRGCNLGYAFACSKLAMHLVDGKHAKQDVPGAMSLLQRACDAGRWEDCETIGNLYRDGKGVNKNPVAAIAAYEQACDKGGARACNSGGTLYAKGEGLPKDPAKARALYEKGCPEKSPGWDACKSLGEAMEKGVGGAKDMAKAAEVYERGCMKGGCLRAGQIWEKGEGGVKPDPERALAAYEKGCNRTSDKDACKAYGKLLEGKDKAKALAFWTDYCNRMGLSEKWACAESKRLGGTGVRDPNWKPAPVVPPPPPAKK